MRRYIVIALSALITMSCSDGLGSNPVKSGAEGKYSGQIATTSATLDSIGLIHNNALAIAYQALVSNQIPVHTSSPSRTLIADSIKSIMNAHFTTLGLNSSSVVDTYDTYAPRMNGTLVNFTDTCSVLSSNAKTIINALDQFIVDYDNGTLSLVQFTSKCDSLKAVCLATLSGDQIIYAGSAVTTAKASAIYWDANAAAWDQEIDPAVPAMRKTDKAILRSDAQSAVGGAITGAFGGPVSALAGAWFGGCVGSIIEGVCIGFGW